MIVKGRQDFYTGLLFMAVGLFFFINGFDLEFGTVADMGPGFLPMVISSLLFAIGVLQTVRGLKFSGASVVFQFREPIIVCLGLIAFGIGLEKVGTLISVFGIMFLSAILHKKFEFKTFAISYAAVAIIVLLFKFGLGSTIPL